METLESRQLLAASLGGNGLLSIAGTDGADTVTISQSGATLLVMQNGSSAKFTRSQVSAINADLSGGGDDLRIAPALSLRASIIGGSGADTIFTGSGADTIDGGSGRDRIDAGAGDDAIVGGPDDDTIDPGLGDDTIDGSSGVDHVSYESRATPITASLMASLVPGPSDHLHRNPWIGQIDGNVTGSNGPEHDTMTAVEDLIGGSGNDKLSSGVVSNAAWETYFPVHALAVSLFGGDGDDSVSIDTGFAPQSNPNALRGLIFIADGGAGNDHVSATAVTRDSAILNGGPGDDVVKQGTVLGTDGAPHAYFDAGHDVYRLVNAQVGLIVMPDELERLELSYNADPYYFTIEGSNGDDEIVADSNSPIRIDGMGGNDRIVSIGTGLDTLRGNDGDDTLIGADGVDRLIGDLGDDSIDAGAGDDVIYGGDGNDALIAGAGRDTVRGEAGNDRLYGNGGSDWLYGNDGDDVLLGCAGNDVLIGGNGRDFLYGGDDADRARKEPTDAVVSQIEELV